MKIELRRTAYNKFNTDGEIWIDGEIYCYTSEARKGANIPKRDCIPCGSYQYYVGIDKLGEKKIYLKNVPDRVEEVSIHYGVDNASPLGCIFVGKNRTKYFLTKSRETIDQLVELCEQHIADSDNFLSITDGHIETPQGEIFLTKKESFVFEILN